LFNRGLFPASLSVSWKDLDIAGTYVIRNVWSQTDEGKSDQKYSATIPAHGVKLIRIYR